jgi:hypothetical protein
MNHPPETHAGHCTCGRIRYRLESAPLIVHCCHCRWCQRETGSAFAVNAMIESGRVTLLSGDPVRTLMPSNSGKGQAVMRCPECRVALWSHYAGAGDKLAFVRVGTLEQPDRLPPQVHIFVDSKQPWVVLPEGVPAFSEYYRRSETWPAESIERLAQLRAADRG